VSGGLWVGTDLGFDLQRCVHVVIVIGVDEVQNLFLLFGEQNRALVVNPPVQLLALGVEMRPVVGIMIGAIAQHQVVEFPNRLLQMIGDLKTLQLDGGEFLAQFAGALPRAMGRPGDKAHHHRDGQYKGNQSEFDAAAH